MYLSSIQAMEHLLDRVGESRWKKWISHDVIAWKLNKDVSHHLSAYGGMGSFNDVVLSTSNGHAVSDEQYPWVNCLFNWLKSICFKCAKNPNKEYTIEELQKEIGYYDSSLAAFVGGENAPASMRQLHNASTTLHGWRCLNCGFGEVTALDIDDFIADTVMPNMTMDACVNGELIELVDTILKLEIPLLKQNREFMKATAISSELSVIEHREGWMSPCPQCNNDDTAVYRWKLTNGKFIPSDDNLKLRKKKK